MDVPINVPTAGRYEIEVVAWADQAGDELARLDVGVLDATNSGSGAEAIRTKLVELYDKLLGVEVTPHSRDVDAAFRLFTEVMERGRSSDYVYQWWLCGWHSDKYFLEGIMDDATSEVLDESEVRYEFDWPRVYSFLESIDFSDAHYTARAWVVVLSYLLMDYRYLYL